MKSDRQLIIAALAILRKQGYIAVWAKATGCREFDVPEGRAGFDLRFYDTKKRSRGLDEPGDFDELGRLTRKIYVGWTNGVLADGTEVNADQVYRAFDNAFKQVGSKLDIVCEGPSMSFSLSIIPALVTSNVFTVEGYNHTLVVRAKDAYEALSLACKALKDMVPEGVTVYQHQMVCRLIDKTPNTTGVLATLKDPR